MIAHERVTLAHEVRIGGIGIHEGCGVEVIARPAPAGHGIVFVREHDGQQTRISASVGSRIDRPRRTALSVDGVVVETVEHLLAAVAGLGLTDLELTMTSSEPPGVDGSALPFAQALAEGGRTSLSAPYPTLKLDRVVRVEAPDGSFIVAHPSPGSLALTYVLELPEPVGRSVATAEVTPACFCSEVAPARTFCLEQEAIALKAMGLGKGAGVHNTLVIGADGRPLENQLRFENEYARHKLLDLFGDLALLEARLEATVYSYRGGHALNGAMCAKLRQLLDAASPLDGPAEKLDEAAVRGGVDPPMLPSSYPSGGGFTLPEHTFSGHFPGRPVLPGVASLAVMAEACGKLDGTRRLVGVCDARFRQVVGPADALVVDLQTPTFCVVEARVLNADKALVAEAQLQFEGR